MTEIFLFGAVWFVLSWIGALLVGQIIHRGLDAPEDGQRTRVRQ